VLMETARRMWQDIQRLYSLLEPYYLRRYASDTAIDAPAQAIRSAPGRHVPAALSLLDCIEVMR
jgi:hypothetical protein